MKETPLVSVIVPVYNVKDYLEECFLSIVGQTYSNLEIILVDDGSTDGSGELCDTLASQDARAVVFHKENGGLSDARNYGLRNARAEWISFIDSDDYVSPVFIEVLLNACLETGCEMSAVPFGKPFNDGAKCELVSSFDLLPNIKCMKSHDVQRSMLYQSLDTGAQWRLCSKESLGIDPFPVGLYYEDLASVYRIIHNLEQVAIVDCRDLYAYRMRGNSIIRQKYKRIKGASALKIVDELYSNITEWYPDLADAAASRCFSVCRMVFAQVPYSPSVAIDSTKDSNQLWGILERFRKTVLKDSEARKRERLAALFACMGRAPFTLFCRLCKTIGLLR